MATSNIVFSVGSIAELGLDQYYLDEEGYSHIVRGHRDLMNIVMTGVKETVQNPTHVYASAYNFKRYQFLSTNVVTARGHPMNVIIQMEKNLGRVITASPKRSITGQIIWDAHTGLYATYDARSDVLYISHDDARPSYADDDSDEPRIWLRFHDDDESPAGVTVFEAAHMWATQHGKLTARISEFLQVEQSDVELRLGKLLPLPRESNAPVSRS